MSTEEHSSRKAGIGMLTIAWAMIFGLLGLFFNEVLEQHNNPNSLPLSRAEPHYTEVELLPNRQHHYVVNGQINQQDVVFLLDTGATDVVIPATVAHQLGLSQGSKHYATTANGTIAVYYTLIEHLAIGDIELHNLTASINPAMDGRVILLGMSALSRIEFSQQADRLVLRQSR
jgi:aspartyl protease family protein